MQVSYQANSFITINFEAKNIKDLFEVLAPLQEVFKCAVCGKCGAKEQDIRFVHRKVSGKYNVYELQCLKCRAKLTLGQKEDGSLFPVRYEKDEQGKPKMVNNQKVYLPNNGWVQWKRDE